MLRSQKRCRYGQAGVEPNGDAVRWTARFGCYLLISDP